MKTSMILVKDAIKRGEYKETALDMIKRNAEILIQAIDDKYSIYVRGNIEIKGRGVKDYGNGHFAVTEKVLNELKKNYKVALDF